MAPEIFSVRKCYFSFSGFFWPIGRHFLGSPKIAFLIANHQANINTFSLDHVGNIFFIFFSTVSHGLFLPFLDTAGDTHSVKYVVSRIFGYSRLFSFPVQAGPPKLVEPLAANVNNILMASNLGLASGAVLVRCG